MKVDPLTENEEDSAKVKYIAPPLPAQQQELKIHESISKGTPVESCELIAPPWSDDDVPMQEIKVRLDRKSLPVCQEGIVKTEEPPKFVMLANMVLFTLRHDAVRKICSEFT